MSEAQDFGQVALRRLFTIVNGATPDSQNTTLWDGSIPWVTPEDLSSRASREIFHSKRTITESGYASCGTTMVPPGSIVLSTRAPIGNLAIAALPVCFNQGCRALVPAVDVDPRFYFYALSVSTSELNQRGRGTTFLELSSGELAAFKVPNPPLAQQERIANFLDEQTTRIDALIAEKEALLERLRELWTSAVAAAMAGARSADRVPTHYSYYPTVPANWRVVPFKHAVQFVEGPGILAEDFRDEGVPLLRVSCVRDSIATLDGCNFLDPEKVAKKWSHFRVREGDLLISASASMGTVSLVTAETAGAVPYTGIIILRPVEGVAVREFIEHFVVSDQFTRQIDGFKAGATIQHFGPTHLKQMVLALPFGLDEQRRIAAELTSVRTEHSKLEAHTQEHIIRLREYRSSLISAAVTGQLDLNTFKAAA